MKKILVAAAVMACFGTSSRCSKKRLFASMVESVRSTT